MIPDDVRRELDAIKRRVEQIEQAIGENGLLEVRVRNHFNRKVEEISKGVELHIKNAIHVEMKEFAGLAESLKGHRDTMDKAVKLLERQEARDEAAKAAKEEEELELKRRERKWAYRTPILVFAATVLTALSGLIGAAIASHH